MRYVWSRFLIMVLACQGALFVWYYNFGPRGIRVLEQLKHIKLITEQEIAQMSQENELLQEQIQAWKDDLFVSEKFAREKLAMQKDGEIVFFRESKKDIHHIV